MHRLSIRDLSVEGKRVLMRVDFNVPLFENGSIRDDMRIQANLPTIEYLIKQKASIVLMSHMGRPDGKVDPNLSLKKVATRLSELLKHRVNFVDDCIGTKAKEAALKLKPTEILMLENLRFHIEEQYPDEKGEFARELASMGVLYVNDAFGVSHRKHASVYEVPRLFETQAACGFLMEKEIEYLSKILLSPPRPFFAIIGGAKISTKIGVVESLLKKVDTLMIGGAMAYTFLKASGLDIGNSLVENDYLLEANKVMKMAKDKEIHLLLPQDVLISKSFKEPIEMKEISCDQGIPQGFEGVSIGSKTLKSWEEKVQNAHCVFWNGPLGVFEVKEFATATFEMAKTLSNLDALTIGGGGDSLAAINQSGVAAGFSHLSTGGGASLEYIEYGTLPGIEVLSTI